MKLLLAVLLSAAWAQEPPPATPEEPVEVPVPEVPQDAPPEEQPDPLPTTEEGGEVVHEIVVHGELAAEVAREQVLSDLSQQGYTEEIDKGDHVIRRHAEPWKGEVLVYDDGWVRMRRQRLRVEGREMPWAAKNSPLAWAGCLVYPWLCVRTGGALVSKRKLMAQKVRTIETMEGDLADWGDRVADLSTDRRVSGLPDQLQALWDDGRPLNGSDLVLLTPGLRKSSMLDFWESRTDTPWGNQVRAVVELFIREEVQYSPWPFTDEEIARFNADRNCERELDLTRPWSTVLADLEGPIVPIEWDPQ